VDHAAAEIGRFAELRVAHDVEIGIAGEAEALAEGGAPGLFDVDQDLKGVVQAEARVEREDARSGFFITSAQAVRATIGGRKIGMRLEYKIGLAGKPVTAVRKVRKDRFGRLDAFVGRFVRVVWRGGLIRSHGGGRGFNGRRVGLLGTRRDSTRRREYDARKRDNEDRRPRARSIGEVRHPS